MTLYPNRKTVHVELFDNTYSCIGSGVRVRVRVRVRIRIRVRDRVKVSLRVRVRVGMRVIGSVCSRNIRVRA